MGSVQSCALGCKLVSAEAEKAAAFITISASYICPLTVWITSAPALSAPKLSKRCPPKPKKPRGFLLHLLFFSSFSSFTEMQFILGLLCSFNSHAEHGIGAKLSQGCWRTPWEFADLDKTHFFPSVFCGGISGVCCVQCSHWILWADTSHREEEATGPILFWSTQLELERASWEVANWNSTDVDSVREKI